MILRWSFFQWVQGDPPEVGYTVSDTVRRVTGKPGRTFAQWAVEHANVFRSVLAS